MTLVCLLIQKIRLLTRSGVMVIWVIFSVFAGNSLVIAGPPPPPTRAECEAGLTVSPVVSDLAFGGILDADGGGGTVDVATNGAPTYNGVVAWGVEPVSAAEITISEAINNGCNAFDLTITVDTNPAVLSRSGGGASMNVTNFITDPVNGVFWSNSLKKLLIGGRLTIVDGQLAGTYSGTFNITFAFQ